MSTAPHEVRLDEICRLLLAAVTLGLPSCGSPEALVPGSSSEANLATQEEDRSSTSEPSAQPREEEALEDGMTPPRGEPMEALPEAPGELEGNLGGERETESTAPTEGEPNAETPDPGDELEPGSGEPPVPPFPTEERMGWAFVAGDGLATTSGGEGGLTVTARGAEELLDFASREEPLIIEISGTVRAGRVQVRSNKTLRGVGPSATLEGGLRIRGTADDFVQNVMVQNLTINAAFSDVEGDGIQVHYAHHVWVDHCDVFDAADGNLDIVHGSNFVTVSWSVFHYTEDAPDPAHRFSTLIGHSDSESAQAEDTGRLRVTLHHNWWADGVIERMPRVRFGNVHVLNNYYSSAGNNYAIRAAYNSRVLAEGNYFETVDDPHEINNDEGGPAQLMAVDNIYSETTGARDATGTAFVPGYEYAVTPTPRIAELVRSQAGPR